MIDYNAIHAKAHEWASHRSPPPKHEPVIAALFAGFGAAIVCILAFGIAGVDEPTKRRATTATVFIIGCLTFLWFWMEKRRYDRAYDSFHAMLLEEAKGKQTATVKSEE